MLWKGPPPTHPIRFLYTHMNTKYHHHYRHHQQQQQARALAANLARAHLYVLRETGHQVMQERPHETLALIEAFVDDLLRSSSAAASGASSVSEEEGGECRSELRALLKEGTNHALHPGQFPRWVHAEGEGEEGGGQG